MRYLQTRGGMYDSRPQAEHILALLSGDRRWEEAYASRGHGEYIENVYVMTANLFAASDDWTIDRVDAVIETMAPEWR